MGEIEFHGYHTGNPLKVLRATFVIIIPFHFWINLNLNLNYTAMEEVNLVNDGKNLQVMVMMMVVIMVIIVVILQVIRLAQLR